MSRVPLEESECYEVLKSCAELSYFVGHCNISVITAKTHERNSKRSVKLDRVQLQCTLRKHLLTWFLGRSVAIWKANGNKNGWPVYNFTNAATSGVNWFNIDIDGPGPSWIPVCSEQEYVSPNEPSLLRILTEASM
jgi:hypothetical protein